MKKHLIPVFLLFSVSFLQSADVEVTVKGVNSIKGKLMIAFYDQANNFRIKELPQSPIVPVASAGDIVAVANDLEPGIYAVAVIWDQNNNGVLDTKGRFKIPVEPYGFSNNPKSRFGPPAYEKCAFRLTEAGGRIQIFLK